MVHQIYADFFEENIFSDFFNRACFRIICILFCPVLIRLKLQYCTPNVFTIIFMECSVRYYKRIFLASLFHNDSFLYIKNANHYGHTKGIRIEQPLWQSTNIVIIKGTRQRDVFISVFFMNGLLQSFHACTFSVQYWNSFRNFAVSSRNHARIYVVLYRAVSVLSVMFIPGSCCLTIRSVDSSRFFIVPPRFRNQISKSVHISSPLWSWFTQQKLRKMFCQVPATPFSQNIICCCEVITEFSNRHLPTVNCHQNRL